MVFPFFLITLLLHSFASHAFFPLKIIRIHTSCEFWLCYFFLALSNLNTLATSLKQFSHFGGAKINSFNNSKPREETKKQKKKIIKWNILFSPAFQKYSNIKIKYL